MADMGVASLINVPQVDALGLVSKAQGIQQGKLQIQAGELNNKLLGMNVAQTEAQRAAAQRALDPNGDFDVNKYAGGLAAGGASPEAILQAQQTRQAQLQAHISSLGLTAAQQAQSEREMGYGAMLGQSVLANGKADPKYLSKKSIGTALDSMLLKTGLLRSPEARQHAMDFLETLTENPQENAKIVQAWVNSSTDIIKALGAVRDVNLGNRVAQVRTNPATGETEEIGGLKPGLSAAEAAQLVDVKDEATGKVYKVPRGALSDQAGAQPGPSGGSGRYPGGRSAVDPNAPPGAVSLSQIAPEAQAARNTSAQQSALVYQKDTAEAGGYSQRLQGLNKAYENLEGATTGKGTAKLQTYGAVLNSFFPGKAPTDVDKYAEAEKYLTDYAVRRGGELGMGTDAARAMVSAANPGVQTPKGAAIAVLNVMKGLERMQAAQVAAADAAGIQADQYTAWRAKWNRSVDPAAFAAPKLDKAGWEAKRKELGDKWPAYKKGLDAALAAGVLTAADLRK